jgi:glycosyltransferase involved in cell wall biosynthesis
MWFIIDKNLQKGALNLKERIAVLIPCFNEEQTIRKVISDFKKALPEAEIYVYDNNSEDQTKAIAQATGVHVSSESRQGKGHVVRAMFHDIEADYYLMVDGDDTYPANEAEKLLAPLRTGQADMTLGDRLSNGRYFEENKRRFHSFGNVLVRKMINFSFHGAYHDILSGYRGFNRAFVKTFPVLVSGFEIETALSIHALDKRMRVVEVPVDYHDRPEGSESHLNTYSDGIKVMGVLFDLTRLYRPLFFFGLMAILITAIGLGVGIPIVHSFTVSHTVQLPSALLAVGLVIIGVLTAVVALILDSIARQGKVNFEFELNRQSELSKLLRQEDDDG